VSIVRKREQLSQELHDWVIDRNVEQCYGKIKEAGNEIHKNPNQEKNYDVKGFYPDIVVYNPKKKEVTLIDEVETIVGDIEVNQWKDFAKLGIARFSVTIPVSEVTNAKQRIKSEKIGVTGLWSFETEYPKEKTIKFKQESLT